MHKIKVRILKDRNINLKVNGEIFDQIKNKAIKQGHFVADYINLLLLAHLNDAGTNIEMQLDKSSLKQTQKMED